jgi:thiol-disulfide isomerase/thioredoxin
MKIQSHVKSRNRLVIPGMTALVLAALSAGALAAATDAAVKAGDKVLAFEGKSTEGKTVKFPQDYKGKVVLLDFWATWCGPCMSEMPNVIAAYGKYHDQGLEILGISLDQENSAAKLESVTKAQKMPWPQIYDGKYWKAAIAVQYNIRAIPHAFLVDGTTGLIVADGENIRGNNLDPAIKKALAARTASAP